MEECNITINKNAVPGDTKPFVPGGIRLGTPAMTTRGLKENHFHTVADFIERGVQIALEINAVGENSKKLKSFQSAVKQDHPKIEALRKEVVEFASKFYMP